MYVFLLALLCSTGIGHGKGIDETPLRSLAEFLLVQHPIGVRGNRISTASRQGKTGVIGRGRKIAAMNVEGMDSRFAEAKRFNVRDLPGISAPLGFFDPLGFTEGASEGKIRFYREAEIKHGRVGMLAALGILVGEQLHPMFGGNIDVPAYMAFGQTPLAEYEGDLLFVIAIIEYLSIATFNSPFRGGELWTIRSDYDLGNLGFDPLNLKPTDPRELKEMQTKELNNGRLGMLAAAGMLAQELVTGQKLF